VTTAGEGADVGVGTAGTFVVVMSQRYVASRDG
jgi:hypothetical protein